MSLESFDLLAPAGSSSKEFTKGVIPNMQSPKKQRKNSKKVKRETTDGNTSLSNSIQRLRPFKQLALVISDKFQTRLTWSGVQSLTVPLGAAHAAYRFRPTAAFDVDPALGSTAMPGYAELSALYASYRVVQSRLRVSLVSPTSGTATCVCVPMNEDIGASPTYGVISSLVGTPYNEYRVVGAAGSPPSNFDLTMSTEKIFGSKAVYFDDAFASLVSTIPANNWFWVVALILPAVVGGAQSYTFMVRLDIDVEFFQRRFLLA